MRAWIQEFYDEHNLSTWSLAPLAHVGTKTLQLFEDGKYDDIRDQESIDKINKAIRIIIECNLIRPKWDYRGQYGDSFEYHHEFSKNLIAFNQKFRANFEDKDFPQDLQGLLWE